tara:strand:- start:347 stop:826 length:480 start_codon:yes stop_codon:yes gene_type:complete
VTEVGAKIATPDIVSGGQTGADRAALDWAIDHKVSHAGWCPAGRLAEDGRIPEKYQLRETPSSSYPERTRRNVEDSDATLIVSPQSPEGGTLLTLRHAKEINKPVLVVTLQNEKEAPVLLRSFIRKHKISALNVAGPRISGSNEVEGMVRRLLDETFGN